MPRRRYRVSRGAPRRRTFWVNTIISDNVGNAAQVKEDLLATPSQFDKYGLTVVRTLIHLSLQPGTLFGAVGTQAFDMAIGVIEQDAFAASALPDLNFPDDQPGRGYLWKERFIVNDHTTAGALPVTQSLMRDLKGRRKIDDMELVWWADNNTITGTAFAVRVEGQIRQLFMR